jgi:hypothetical protein
MSSRSLGKVDDRLMVPVVNHDQKTGSPGNWSDIADNGAGHMISLNALGASFATAQIWVVGDSGSDSESVSLRLEQWSPTGTTYSGTKVDITNTSDQIKTGSKTTVLENSQNAQMKLRWKVSSSNTANLKFAGVLYEF